MMTEPRLHAPAPDPGTVNVLLVCRANRCRSPYAAALARRRAAGADLRVYSAGLLPGGFPTPPAGVRVAARHGLDLTGHVSRRLDAGAGSGFDLVLTMARDQARDLVADDPDLWPRVFTLKQFDRWVAARRVPADRPLASWLAESAATRSRRDLLGADPRDDVADPIHRTSLAWRRMHGELDSALARVIPALSGRRARSSRA